MRATIDKAGRLVIPKPLRDSLGLGPGPVEVEMDGAGLRIEAPADDRLERRGGRLVIPPSGTVVTDADIQALRDALQR